MFVDSSLDTVIECVIIT